MHTKMDRREKISLDPTVMINFMSNEDILDTTDESEV